MDNQEDLKRIELTIEEAQKGVARMNQLDKLTKNREFKAIFLEGLFKEEPARLVAMKADPAMQDERNQAAIMRELDMIGTLRGYLQGIMQMGRQLQHEIEQNEKVREEILAEEAAGYDEEDAA